MPSKGCDSTITFNVSAEDIVGNTNLLIRELEDVLCSEVADVSSTVESILQILTKVELSCRRKIAYLSLLQAVSTNEEIKDASTKAEKALREFKVKKIMHSALCKKLLVLQQKEDNSEFKTHVDEFLHLEDNGLNLNEDSQNLIKEKSLRINNLVVDFMKNMNKSSTKLTFSYHQLKGLPADFLQSLKRTPDNKKCELSLDYHNYVLIMESCSVSKTRRELEFAFNSKCIKENGLILTELRKLRHEVAVLKGYTCHASYRNKDYKTLFYLLTELGEKMFPAWKEEKKYLLQLKKEHCAEIGEQFDEKLNSFDIDFFISRSKDIKMGFKKMQLKEFFPYLVVKNGLLTSYQELLGLKFTPVDGEKWHQDIELFSVSDSSEENTLLGFIYFDMFPRDNKYGHEAVFKLQDSIKNSDGSRQPCVYVMVRNFTKCTEDKPSLLDVSEVIKFMHDFGHVMRNICKDIEYPFFSLKSIISNAPSQMLENWPWEKEPLLKMSSHYCDKSAIPPDMLHSLIKWCVADIGYSTFRHVCIALYDQTIYSSPEGDATEIYNNIVKRYIGIPPQPGTDYPLNFIHLVEPYDARYYEFLLPKVYSMDMSETGCEILFNHDKREKILGSEDVSETLGERLWGLTEMFLDSSRNFLAGVKSLCSFRHMCWGLLTSSAVVLLTPMIFQVESTELIEVQCQQQ